MPENFLSQEDDAAQQEALMRVDGRLSCLVCKDRRLKQRKRFVSCLSDRAIEGDSSWKFVEEMERQTPPNDGEEIATHRMLPEGARVYSHDLDETA